MIDGQGISFGCLGAVLLSLVFWALLAFGVHEAIGARASVAPPTSYPLTSAARAFREQTYRLHPCLAAIVDLENGLWDPTVDFGGGHGNVYQAYGLGQATPGTKMAAYGPDWRTSRATQLRWLIGYTRSRFGSECAALAHRRGKGWY